MKRLELECIRICNRCGRGAAELRGDDGTSLVVTLDPVRARELARCRDGDDVRSLTDLFLDQLAASGCEPGEVVIDLADGRLRALLSFLHQGETDVVACTPEEGIALMLRGDLKLYATDEAVSHTAATPRRAHNHGGSETLH